MGEVALLPSVCFWRRFQLYVHGIWNCAKETALRTVPRCFSFDNNTNLTVYNRATCVRVAHQTNYVICVCVSGASWFYICTNRKKHNKQISAEPIRTMPIGTRDGVLMAQIAFKYNKWVPFDEAERGRCTHVHLWPPQC